MKKVTFYFLGVVLVLNVLAALLTPSGQAPLTPAPAPAQTLTAPAPTPDDAEPCVRWVAQGFACEFIVFPEMEIRPSPEAAVDNALAAARP
ncbi:MAG: hypothetical protein IT385_22480 [Deltaproteobacteria bacterium]|nr:hypothetical protein [Deltaproteobacteria bacterium]